MPPPIATFLSKDELVSKYDLTSLQCIYCSAAPLGKDTCILLLDRLPNLKFILQCTCLFSAHMHIYNTNLQYTECQSTVSHTNVHQLKRVVKNQNLVALVHLLLIMNARLFVVIRIHLFYYCSGDQSGNWANTWH
jgi:hypothetical protein